MPPDDLPPTLGAAFDVVAARRAGVTPSRLRRRDLERPFYAARSVIGASLIVDDEVDARRAYPRSDEEKSIHRRAMQFATVMPDDAFFAGVTAAVLWDAPVPKKLLTGADDPLDVGVLWPHRAPRHSGIRGHAFRPPLVYTVAHPVSGLRLASPASTWAMLATAVTHPYDLIAVADYFVRVIRPPYSRPNEPVAPPLATLKQLTAAVSAGRRQGVRFLRDAFPRVRTGSASRPETWTRLTLIDGGLPEPALDHDVFDHAGRFVARVDQAYPQWKITIEYEGAHHNTDEQWESDIERYARLEAAGWLVIRVSRTLLFQHPDLLVARVRDAIARRSR